MSEIKVSYVNLGRGIIVTSGTLNPVTGLFRSASGEIQVYLNPRRVASVLASERRLHAARDRERERARMSE